MTNGTEDKRFKKVRHEVSDWLLAESWQVKEITEKAEGAAWAISANDGRGRVVHFAQKSNKPDVLLMQAPIDIGQSDQTRMGTIGQEQAEGLAWDLRFQLLNMGIEFQGLAVPLKRINLISRMYTDGLDRNGFFGRLDRLLNGILATIWMIRRLLDQPAPEEDADGIAIN